MAAEVERVAKEKRFMKIEMRKTAEVKPYERNPRLNDAAVDAVAHSIKEFGWRQPIVVDAEGVIICGHTRWKAAQKLGLDKVPVHVATDLTPTQVKAYRIADNKLAELAEWNMELLPIELAELKEAGVDMTLLGFSLDELNLQQGQTDPDNVPSPPDKATSAKGEIYQLGNHRLMCGDSGSVADLDALLAGAPVHLVNTDPPYNVKVEPRSNNAIAAGLSSFAGLATTSMPLARQGSDPPPGIRPGAGQRARPTAPRARCAPKTGPWRTTSSRTRRSKDAPEGVVRKHRPRPLAGPGLLHLGRLRQLRQLPARS